MNIYLMETCQEGFISLEMECYATAVQHICIQSAFFVSFWPFDETRFYLQVNKCSLFSNYTSVKVKAA